jgi:hypothetical protein
MPLRHVAAGKRLEPIVTVVLPHEMVFRQKAKGNRTICASMSARLPCEKSRGILVAFDEKDVTFCTLAEQKRKIRIKEALVVLFEIALCLMRNLAFRLAFTKPPPVFR